MFLVFFPFNTWKTGDESPSSLPIATGEAACPRPTPLLQRFPQRFFIMSMRPTLGTQPVTSFTVGIFQPLLPIEKQCSRFPTGMVVILYFECATAILKPQSRRVGGGKWGLLAYTTFLFALGTIYTCCNLRVRQLSYIDNRNFPGKAPSLPPGPIGYTLFSQSKPTSVLSDASFTTANWMADGFLVSW